MAASHDQTEVDRRALAIVLTIAAAQDALYALLFLSYMNHYLLDVLGSSPGLPGYTLALYGAVKLGVHPLAGRLIDRTSPRAALRLAVLAQVAGMVALAASHTLGGFLVAAALLGAGSATAWPLVYDLVARTQAEAVRTRVTGLLAFAGYVATGAGFAAGVLFSRFADYRAAFAAAAVLVAAQALLQGARELTQPRFLETEANSSADPVARQRRGPLVLFGAIVFLDYAAISSIAGVYGPFTHRSLDLSLLATTLYMAPAGAAAFVGLYASSKWSRPARRLREMGVLYFAAGLGALAVAAAPNPAAAAAAAIPLALGVGGIGPIIAAALIGVSGGADRGLVLGSLMSVEGVGSVLGPGGAALVSDAVGPRAGVAAIGGVFLVLVVVTLAAAARVREPAKLEPPPVPV